MKVGERFRFGIGWLKPWLFQAVWFPPFAKNAKNGTRDSSLGRETKTDWKGRPPAFGILLGLALHGSA